MVHGSTIVYLMSMLTTSRDVTGVLKTLYYNKRVRHPRPLASLRHRSVDRRNHKNAADAAAISGDDEIPEEEEKTLRKKQASHPFDDA